MLKRKRRRILNDDIRNDDWRPAMMLVYVAAIALIAGLLTWITDLIWPF